MEMDTHELIENQRRLRRLALSILGDAARADDAVQDTWIAALQARAPGGDQDSWLAGILRKRAYKQRRAEARRAEHEARGAEGRGSRDEVGSTLDHGRALYDALEQLDEPYRVVVVRRYLRDESPPQIAARLGVPLETVRTRLRRGLAQLRERLDREHAGWALAFLPLTGAPAPAISSLALTLGGWMFAKWIAAGVGLALVLALAWSAREDAVGPAAAEGPVGELAPAPTVIPARVTAPPPAVETSARVAIEPGLAALAEELEPPVLRVALEGWRAADEGEVQLRLMLADRDIGFSAAQEVVELASVSRRPQRAEIHLSLRSVLGEADTWPGTIELITEHPDYVPARGLVELERDVDTIDVALALERAAFIVRGVAQGPGGAILSHGRATLFVLDEEPFHVGAETLTDSTPASEPEEQVELGTDGAFRLRSRSAGTHVLLVHDANPMVRMFPNAPPTAQLAPISRRLPAGVGEVLDVGTLELGTGLSIRGEVPAWRGYGGFVMANATVAWNARPSYGDLRWFEGAFVRILVDTRVDRDGRFELTGLAPIEFQISASSRGDGEVNGPYRLTLDGGAGFRVQARAPEDDVVLEQEVERCELEVNSDGRPLVGASIRLSGPSGSVGSPLLSTHEIGLEYPAGEPVELLVQHSEHEPVTLQLESVSIPSDGVLRVELEPAAPRASFTLVPSGAHAQELEGTPVIVELRRLTESEEPAQPVRAFNIPGARTGDWIEWSSGTKPPGLRILRDGRLARIEGLAPGRYAVAVGPRLDSARVCAPLVYETTLELAPGAAPRLDWPVELGVMPRVSIEGEPAEPITYIRLRAGQETLGGFIWFHGGTVPGTYTWGASPLPTGRSVGKGTLPPGSYEFQLFRGSTIVHTHAFELTLDGSAEIVVDVSGL